MNGEPPPPAEPSPEPPKNPETPSAALPRAQRLQKIHDSGRNLVPPEQLDEAAKPTSILGDGLKLEQRTESEAETGAGPGPGAGAGPGPGTGPGFIPRTKVYDVSLTRRLEADPELVRSLSEPGFATPPLPLPRPAVQVPPPPGARRWRLPGFLRVDPAKLKRRAIGILVSVVVVRLVLALVLDFALDVVARELLGLEVRVGHSSLRLLSGEAVFEDLTLATPGGKPVATVGRAELDVRWSALPRIVIHRAVLEDATVTLRREVDGSMPALSEIEELIVSKPKKPSSGKPPRVVLEAVRVAHGRFEWEDLSTKPALRETVELEARADDLALDGSRRARPARLSVRLAAPGILDAFRLDAAARPDEGDARIVDLSLALEGHPRLLAAYLAPHARPDARAVSLDLDARLVVRKPLLSEEADGERADLTVEHVSLKADDEELGFDRLVVSARRIARDALEISSIAVDRPRAALARLDGGALRIAGFAFPPHEDEDEAPRKGVGFELPQLVIDEVALHGGRFHFVDETVLPRVDLVARDIEASVRDLVKDEKRPDASARIEASVTVDRVVQSLRVTGSAEPFGTPRKAELLLTGRGIGLSGLEPWLARAGLESGIANGTLSARLEGSVRESGEKLALEAAVKDLVLAGEGEPTFSLSKVEATGASFERGTLEAGKVSIVAPRVRIVRDARGAVAFLGLKTRPGAEPPPESPPARRKRKPFFVRHVAVESLSLEGGSCRWHDEALGQPVDLALEEGTLAVSGIAFDTSSTPSGPPRPARLRATARLAPGIGSVALEAGLVPDPAAPAISGTLAASGLSLRPLAPYLERAGIVPVLEDGRLVAHVDASTRAHGLGLEDGHVVVEKLSLRAAEELAAVDRLELAGAAVLPAARRVELGDVTIEGARARVTRVAPGTTEAFGLRFLERPAAESQPGGEVPHVRWGEVTLRRGALLWRDAAVEPAATIELTRIDASLGARYLDHSEMAGPPPVERPAPFTLHAEVANALGSLDLAGGLVASTRAPVFFAEVAARGITLRALDPYLARAGIASELAAGELRARIEGSALVAPGSVRATFEVRDLSLEDGRELAALERAELSLDLERASHELSLGGATVLRPRATVTRRQGGELSLLGLRFGPSKAPPGAPSAPLALVLSGAKVEDLAVRFDDEVAGARLDLVRARAELGAARIGPGAASAPFALHAEVAGVGSLDAAGGVRLDGAAPSVSATVALRHLRGKPLDPYFRDRGALLLEDGAIDARIGCSRKPAEDGGAFYDGAIEGFELREGERRLLAFSVLRVLVPRVDDRVLLVDQAALGAVDGQLERFADGRIRFAGFELRPAPSKAPLPPAEEREVDEQHLPPLPRIEVKNVAAICDRLAIYDRAGDAPPFVVENLVVSQPWAFQLTNDARASALVYLAVSFGVKDVLESATVHLQVLPFDSEPHAALEVEVKGFSGPAFLARAPELASRVDPSALAKASFKADATFDLRNRLRLDALLANARRTPIAFDLDVTDVETRATPDGPVLLGCDELHVDATSWNVATGEARLRAVELSNPRLRARKEKDGLRFLDAVWKPAPAEAPREEPPGPELRIDRISVTDGDILLEDGSVMPPSSLPLSALDLELSGFSSRVLRERRTLRVSLAARSGGFFDELAAHGQLALFPEIDGDADATLAGVRVIQLSGYTQREWRLALKSGRIDADLRARARNGRIANDWRFALNEVEVEEGNDRFEGSVIGEKAGISVKKALAILRDDDGVVALDLHPVMPFHGFELQGSIDWPGLWAEAIATGVKGVTSKPLAMIEDVGKSVKGAVAGHEDSERKSSKVPFEPADTLLPEAMKADLREIAARLKSDAKLRVSLRAEIGTRDEERAKKLAAPAAEERRDLIARLEARRARLEARRADAEAGVRAALLSGSPDEIGKERARHTRAERAVEEADRSLDALYDQERGARGHGAEQRTHQVALSLCDARVESIRAFLVSEGASVEQIRALRARARAADESGASGTVVCTVEPIPGK